MYTLHIGPSRSPNYSKAVQWMQLMGAKKIGDDWVLKFTEEIKAYRAMFPIFRLRAMEWKNTKAYVNGKRVNNYRYVFQQHQKRDNDFIGILDKIKDNIPAKFLPYEPMPFIHYKREGNTFFFRGYNRDFSIELEGKTLYDFVDCYDVGDIVFFE